MKQKPIKAFLAVPFIFKSRPEVIFDSTFRLPVFGLSEAAEEYAKKVWPATGQVVEVSITLSPKKTK